MPHINLLPWREALRKQKQREFLALLGAMAVTGIVVVAGAFLTVNAMINHQNARNTYLKGEITLVEQRIKEINELEKVKQALLDRMEVIQQLQLSRPEIVHVFDEIVNTLPEGMFLTSVAQKSDQIAIEGKAESDARVSAYMRNLDDSAWFKSPRLSVIENKATRDDRGQSQGQDNGVRSFALVVQRETPQDAAKREAKR
ncbi:MAG: PilN domain-containing protein [Thiotrichales bacterium]